MRYVERPAPPSLSAFVQCVWLLEDAAADPATIERVVPDGRAEIVVHFGARFRRVARDGRIEEQRRSVAAGQITSHLELAPSGPAGMIGVRLHPSAVRAVLDVPAQELTDQVAGLSELCGRASDELEERVRAAADDEARVAAACAWVTERVRGQRAPPRELQYVVDRIDEMSGGVRIGELAAEIGWNRRRLERAFRDHVGLGPKMLARVARFQLVVRTLEAGSPPDWVRLALAAGYADQSHMVREFGEFAGLSPTRFLAVEHAMSDALSSG